MAKIKTAHGKYSANSNVHFSRTHCGAVVSYDQSTLWVGDDALDYDTLNPIFAKTCGAFIPFGGNGYIMDYRTAMVINKPVAVASHNSAFDSLKGTYNGRSSHQPYTWTRNLDKTERMDNGSAFRFLDSGGNAHHLVFYSYGTSNVNARYVLVQGDDFANPTNRISGVMPEADSTVSTSIHCHDFHPVSVDAVNKVIYAYTHCYRPSYEFTTIYEMFKIPFTTVPVDGSLSLGTPVPMPLGYMGNGRYMDGSPNWYCGKNNAGDPCFLTQIENESLYASTSASGTRRPSTAIKTGHSHRVIFNKYDAVTNTTTTIADLKGDEGFVGDALQATTAAADHTSHYTMSHFEASPIGGETDVYYAYSPCFDSATGNFGLLMHTWNKATDTFATEVASITLDGADVISDFITKAESDTIDNERCTLNVALTKSGTDYYLNVFYTHLSTDGLAYFSQTTHQTLLTLSINAADFSDLSYHSNLAFPACAYAPQDADNTRWFVIEASSANLYTFSAGGWTKAASEAGTCRTIGQDQDARYWTLMQNASDYANVSTVADHLLGSQKPFDVSLHLLSADLPASVSVEFADDTITYAGSDLTKNLLVNAYDGDGNRVAKSVVLKITGSNAVFQSNSATSLTTSTLAGGDLTVPLTISGAGFINISASFAV